MEAYGVRRIAFKSAVERLDGFKLAGGSSYFPNVSLRRSNTECAPAKGSAAEGLGAREEVFGFLRHLRAAQS
jgi:hypothetical protein